MFTTPDALPPFARAPNYGFRCIKVDRPEDITVALTGAVDPQTRDLRVAKPVGDPVFEAWRSLYSFDHGDLNARVHSTDDAPRIRAVLFLPKNSRPPYQTLIFFPGSNVLTESVEHGDHRRRAELHHEKRPGAVVSDLQEHIRTRRRAPRRPPVHDSGFSGSYDHVVERHRALDRLPREPSRHRAKSARLSRSQLGIRHGTALPGTGAAHQGGRPARPRLLHAGGAARSGSSQLRAARAHARY